MASNARPLWSLLPDGALKRQLLGELAELAQLDVRDLSDLWQQAHAREATRRPAAPASDAAPHWDHPPPDAGWFAPSDAGYGKPTGRKSGDWKNSRGPRKNASTWPPQPRMPRSPATGRIDHAARLLLSHMDFLEHLGHEDHAVLCAQPAPHGLLFAWLEDQFHNQGAQPWAVLRESLRNHACEDLAQKVMTGSHAQTEGDLQELRLELRDLLDRMLIDDIKEQQKTLIAQATQDPSALERYRTLEQKRNALQTKMGSPS